MARVWIRLGSVCGALVVSAAGCGAILGIHEIPPPTDGGTDTGADTVTDEDHAALDGMADVAVDAKAFDVEQDALDASQDTLEASPGPLDARADSLADAQAADAGDGDGSVQEPDLPCAQQGTYLFCDDFDSVASVNQTWSGSVVALDGGTWSLDTSDHVSSPASARAAGPALAPSGVGQLDDYLNVPPLTSWIRLALDVRVDVPTYIGIPMVGVAHIYVDASTSDPLRDSAERDRPDRGFHVERREQLPGRSSPGRDLGAHRPAVRSLDGDDGLAIRQRDRLRRRSLRGDPIRPHRVPRRDRGAGHLQRALRARDRQRRGAGAIAVDGAGSIDAGVKPGDVLAGKYRVERVLGVGGMGVVVAAHHLQLDEKVALKFLLPAGLEKPELLARFELEARALVKIKSEHVARVIDVGRLESGAPYMVMEYLEGVDLRAWLRERGAMPVEQAAEFVLQASEAIAEAHTLGIVHRDLKPANLFCVRRADGLLSIKVLDFGISKVVAGRSSMAELDMTRTDAVVGSPLYMSPEQIKASKEVDARADLWSLGVILYELVSGRLPFEEASLTALAVAIATGAPRPLGGRAKDLPPGFEDVVMRCLARDRERRTQNVGELALGLKDYAPRRAASSVDRVLRTLQASGAWPSPPAPATTPAAYADTVSADSLPTGTNASWGNTGAMKKGKRWSPARIGVAVAAAVILSTVTGVFVVRGHAEPAAAPKPPPAAGLEGSAPSLAPPPVVEGTLAAVSPSAASASVPDAESTLGPPPSTATTVRPGSPRPPSAPHTAPASSPAPVAVTQSPVAPAAAPSCHIATEYDAEGQPHFRKVCNESVSPPAPSPPDRRRACARRGGRRPPTSCRGAGRRRMHRLE